jgi:hypothetical protein
MAITVDAANAPYSSLDGVLFDKSMTTLIQYPPGKPGSYLIPVNVINIGDEAFAGCTGLTDITISGSIISIGIGAFESCTSLTNVTIPNGVSGIGDGAFFFCSSLTNVTILGSITNIGHSALGYCTNLLAIIMDPANPSYRSADGVLFDKGLTTLIQFPGGKPGSYSIPGSVTNIGHSAFRYGTSLSSLTIPGSVTSIGVLAFADCTSLQRIFFKGNAPSAGSGAFSRTTNAILYYLPGPTGWGATFSGVPTRLWNPLMQSGGPVFGVGPAGFGFNITGTADIPIVVEASTNLANAAWAPLQSLNLTNGAFYFSDPNWTNYSARTYRIRSP